MGIRPNVRCPMRPVSLPLWCTLLVTLTAGPVTLTSRAALAESRVFIIANQSDGYGIDLCLALGDHCGLPVARSFCQSKAFANATGFRKVEAGEVTGAVPHQGNSCSGPGCGDYVAITCQR